MLYTAWQLHNPRSAFLPLIRFSFLLFVAVSHYIMLEVMNLTSLPSQGHAALPITTVYSKAKPYCLCLPSKPATETKCTIWRIGHQSTGEYSETWPKSRSFRFWFCADQWQTIRDQRCKQKSAECEEPFQSKLLGIRQTSNTPYKQSLPWVLHSPVLKHSKDDPSQMLHWEGTDAGRKLPRDAKRYPFLCLPAPWSSLLYNTLLALPTVKSKLQFV